MDVKPKLFHERSYGLRLETTNYLDFKDLPQMLQQVSAPLGLPFTVINQEKSHEKQRYFQIGDVVIDIQRSRRVTEFILKSENKSELMLKIAIEFEAVIPLKEIRKRGARAQIAEVKIEANTVVSQEDIQRIRLYIAQVQYQEPRYFMKSGGKYTLPIRTNSRISPPRKIMKAAALSLDLPYSWIVGKGTGHKVIQIGDSIIHARSPVGYWRIEIHSKSNINQARLIALALQSQIPITDIVSGKLKRNKRAILKADLSNQYQQF